MQNQSIRKHSSTCATLAFILSLSLLQACASGGIRPSRANTTTSDPFKITTIADKAYQRSDWLIAEHNYEELTRLVPNDAYAWNRLGNIRLRQNKFEAAIVAYKNALQRDNEAARTHYNLATAHMLIARKSLQNAQSLLPANDGGAQLIEEKLHYFDALIYEPIIEIPSPNDGLIQQPNN